MKYIHTKQHGKYDCGLACISSILKFYGYNYGINYLTDFTVVKKGYNLKDLLSVLRNFEFLTYKPVEVDKNRLDIVFDNISTPCIALVNENNEGHYIVIYKKKRGKLIISDPKNKQITAIKMDHFSKSFSGVLLMIEPCSEFHKPAQIINTKIDFVKKIVKKNILQLGIVFILSILFVFLSVASSFCIQFLVDEILPRHLEYYLFVWGLSMLGVFIISICFDYFRSLFIVKMANNIDNNISKDYFNHIVKLPIRFFENRESGDIISRFNDASYIRNIVSTSVISGILDLIIIIGIGSVLYRVNTTLFLTTLIPLLLLICLTVLFYDLLSKRNRTVMETKANTNSFLVQFIKNMPTIYALNKKLYFLNSFNTVFKSQLKAILKEQYAANNNGALKKMIQSSSTVLILWVGAQQIMSDAMTLGELLFINSLLMFLMGSLEGLIGLQSQLQKAFVAGNRFLDILQYPVHPEKQQEQGSKIKHIEIQNLNFSFDTFRNIIEGANLILNENEKILIIGESGTGKSTFAKTLTKLYKVENNTIFLNGVDINNISEDTIRKNIVYLNEHPFLFKDSIRENLCMGEDFSDVEIMQACKVANVHEFIYSLPNQLDFHLNENAANLSTGQKQRLAMARAILHRPNILILDESLSNVDIDNFKQIQSNLMSINCMLIFITHNPENVISYDRKFKLDNNKITEVSNLKGAMVVE